MKQEMMIDEARWADYPEIAQLMQTVHQIHSSGRPDIYKEASKIYTEEKFKEDLVNPMLLFLTARIAGKAVGICQVKLSPIPEGTVSKGRERAYVEAVCVRKDWRKKGLAKKLLQRAEEEARKKGIHQLELTVWSFNQEALEFYRNYGMKCQRMIMEKEI